MVGGWRRWSWILIALTLVLPTAATGQATEEIFPLGQIRPGMRGVGRTVIRGTRIEEFGFEVLGITQGPPGPLVLFRAFGPVIERSGGTAAGMSGSPMYIQGRIAGALSYGYVFAGPDQNLGLFTPIEKMLEVLEGGRRARAPEGVVRLAQPVRIAGRRVDQISIAPTMASGRTLASRTGLPTFAPSSTPLVASGLGPRGFRLLERAFQNLPVVPVQGYGGVARFPEGPLVPGASVGVALARGDVNLVTFGTLTYRRGRQFLAFGHPMFGWGESDYMATTAYIHTVVRGIQMPFKEGDLGSVVGTITQDRAAGIGGEVGRIPRVFNVVVKVLDQDTTRSLQFGTQMIRRPDLAQILTPLITMSAVERAWDAFGGGTAEVKTTVRGGGLPRALVRTNRVYSARDLSAAAALDVVEAARILFHNEFTAVRPTDVTVEVGLTRRPVIASIVEVRAESRAVPQGGKLRVRLRLRPYQEDEHLSRVVEIDIPKNFPKGPAVLVVGSAGSSRDLADPATLLLSRITSEPPPTRLDNLDQEIEFFEGFGLNTDVLLQLIPAGVPPSDDPTKRFIYFDEFAGRLVHTNWVIRGEVVIPIVVE